MVDTAQIPSHKRRRLITLTVAQWELLRALAGERRCFVGVLLGRLIEREARRTGLRLPLSRQLAALRRLR